MKMRLSEAFQKQGEKMQFLVAFEGLNYQKRLKIDRVFCQQFLKKHSCPENRDDST
jgi:hypothetical protein